ncbi:MAG: enoyl-CoA hydratase-related protein [Acidobacteriota bacterium]
MELTNLLYEASEGIAVITVNRPDKLNALNRETLKELAQVLQAAEEDASVKAVLVTGAGEKAFVAGADISEIASLDAQAGRNFALFGQNLFRSLETFTKPVIAAVNGFALGGGCELALACDWRFAGESAQIGVPEILLGIIPGAGGTQRLPRLIGPAKAKEMIFSGRFYDAKTCHAYGVVDKVVEGEGSAVIAEAQKVAKRYATKYPPFALSMAKRAVNNGMNCSLTDGLVIEAQGIALCFSTEDQKVGMRTFIEKGPGQAEFAGK